MRTDLPRYERPEEVELFYQTACMGDLEEVKKQVQRLLHDPGPSSEPEKPHPACFFGSLAIAIKKPKHRNSAIPA
jgi:hypothetical protein